MDHSPGPDTHLGGGPAEVFTFRTVMPVPARRLFRWHERPDALPALLPRGPFARIERRTGGIRDGGAVVFSFGVGPMRIRWEARHFGYVADRQFCDEQVHGPFRRWRHTHRVVPVGDAQSLYEDHVEFQARGGAIGRWLLHPILRRALPRMFRARHAIVRRHLLASGVEGVRTRHARPAAPAT